MSHSSPQNIRPLILKDIPALQTVISANEMFPPEMLPEMVAPFLEDKAEGEYWLSWEHKGEAIALAYFAPERMTEGTYNLYLIAVDPAHHSQGIGQKMMRYIESFLANQSVRILLVETSGLPEFARTRSFYHQNGYTEEGRIREFYAKGEDKVIFWKKLATN
ncbi:MAG: GNAT family N-acetyltransferase [Bacteroidota bacterium]